MCKFDVVFCGIRCNCCWLTFEMWIELVRCSSNGEREGGEKWEMRQSWRRFDRIPTTKSSLIFMFINIKVCINAFICDLCGKDPFYISPNNQIQNGKILNVTFDENAYTFYHIGFPPISSSAVHTFQTHLILNIRKSAAFAQQQLNLTWKYFIYFIHRH